MHEPTKRSTVGWRRALTSVRTPSSSFSSSSSLLVLLLVVVVLLVLLVVLLVLMRALLALPWQAGAAPTFAIRRASTLGAVT